MKHRTTKNKELNSKKKLEFDNEGLPKGWTKIVLKDHVSIAGRIGWRGLKRSEYTDTGPFLLAVKDINSNGQIDYNGVKDHLSQFRYDESPEIKLQKYDILVTKDGTIGKIGYVNILPYPTTVNSSILVVRPDPMILQKYLFHYFRSPFFQQIVQEKIKGIAIPHLFQYDIKKFHLRIPPLPEQRRIVQKIESIFSQIDAAKENLEKLALQMSSASGSLVQLKSSVLKQAFEGRLVSQDPNDEPVEILLKKIHKDSKKELELDNERLPKGWIVINLAKIADINPRKPKRDEINKNMEVTFLPMKCVEELTGNIDLSKTRKYGEVYKGYTYFANNDIIFAKITPCMENGKIAIVSNLKNGIGFGSTEFHVIRLIDDLLDKKFCFYYLIQDEFRNIAQNHMKGTAGQLRVPTDYLENVLFSLPPLQEQKRIVSKIESIFAKIDAVWKSRCLRILYSHSAHTVC